MQKETDLNSGLNLKIIILTSKIQLKSIETGTIPNTLPNFTFISVWKSDFVTKAVA